MKTVNSICKDLADKYVHHIVTIDHNVPESYESEFSFHVICHPTIEDGAPRAPDDIIEFVNNIAEEMDVETHEMHVHINAQVSEEVLGIDDNQIEGLVGETTSD